MASVKQDINMGLVFFVGIVGSLVLYISVVGTVAWFNYEREAVVESRYAADENVDWIKLKTEQYRNIGDPVGNATIYAAAPDSDDFGAGPAFGYRYLSDDKQAVAVPIHVAMAQLVAEQGGESSQQQMLAADKSLVKTVNDAYASPFIVAEETNANQTAERVTLDE